MKTFVPLFIIAAFISCSLSAQVIFYVQQPPALEGNHDLSWAQWAQTPDMTNPANAIIDTLVFVDDGTTADSLGCNTLVNDSQIAGKIAVVYRGTCQFGVKSVKAQNAGAIGVVIINNVPGDPIAMGAGTDGDNVTIPVVMITQTSGAILRDEILAGNVVAFIGSKVGYFSNDIGFGHKDVLLPPATSNPVAISGNNNEFSAPLHAWVFNYGSMPQTGITVSANISYSGNTIYSNTSSPVNINPGDSVLVTFPVFSQPAYTVGLYRLEYNTSMPGTDEFPADNVLRYDFAISDDVFAYAPVDTLTFLPVSTNYYRPSNNPGEFEECIHFRDTFASRLKARGLYFSAGTTQTDSLTGVYIETNLYEWGDIFTDINDPNLNMTSLTTVAYGSYSYASNLQDQVVYVPFDVPYDLEDYKRYLFCVKTYDVYVYLGFNSNADYDEHIYSTYLQPVSLVNDNGTWYVTGFGTDVVASIGAKFDPPPITASGIGKPSCAGMCDGYLAISLTGGTAPYTYVWSNGQSSETITGLCDGLYTVTVTDGVGVTSVASFAIDDPMPVSNNIISVNITCSGSCNGTAEAVTAGGTPPYAYLWNDPQLQATAIATGLCSGIYTVTVADDNGCTSVSSASLSDPAGMTVSSQIINSSCGSANGSGTASVTGGTPPYAYLWDALAGNQITATATGLAAGTYYLTITDSSNCTVITSISLSDSGAPAVTVTVVSDLLCYGAQTGLVTADASGGVMPYAFLWSDSQGQDSSTATGLAAGNYNVSVTDGAGCLATAVATITQPQAIAIAVTNQQPVHCIGGTDGSTSSFVTGGVTPYTYSWVDLTDTSIVSITSTATGLSVGNYNLGITDSNGCPASYPFSVTQFPPASIAGATVTDVGCFNDDNGSVNISITDGNMPYIYAWSNNEVTQDISDLLPGTYSVTVTDDDGCTVTATYVITGPAAALQVTVDNVQQQTINITVTGGTTPYTYQWSNGSAVEDPGPLSAGTYSVTVTDANGCKAYQSGITVTGIAEMADPYLLEITPNPGKGFFMLSIELPKSMAGELFEFSVMDLTGRTVASWKDVVKDRYSHVIDLTAMPQGFYTIDVSNPAAREILRIEKID